MTLFALDTSTRAGSMALWRDGDVAAVVGQDARSHAERQPNEAVAWLATFGIGLADLRAFVVITGPGSFTGLRVGVAAVQGWASALGRPVHAVPTLRAVRRACPDAGGAGALVVSAVDGHRAEVFYALEDGGSWPVAAAVGAAADVMAEVAASHAGRMVRVTGNAVERYGEVFAAAGWQVVTPVMPVAEAAVRLVAEGDVPAGAPGQIRLEYVRRTDAELNRERQAARRT